MTEGGSGVSAKDGISTKIAKISAGGFIPIAESGTPTENQKTGGLAGLCIPKFDYIHRIAPSDQCWHLPRLGLNTGMVAVAEISGEPSS